MNKLLRLITLISLMAIAPFSPATGQSYVKIDPSFGIEVELTTSSQCTWGDLDLIGMERFEHRRKGGDADFVVSIETFDQSPTITRSVTRELNDWLSKNGNTESKTIRLDRPENLEPKLAGLYICKRSQGPRPCRDLEVSDFNEIVGRHSVKLDDSGQVIRRDPALYDISVAPPDSPYFFYPITVSRSEITVFTSALTDEELKNFSDTLKQLNITDYYNSGIVSRNINLIRSAPLKVKGNKIVVNIPHSNQRKCSGAEDPFNKQY